MKLQDVLAQHRVNTSESMASAFIVGIDNCSENEHPLTQTQQIDLLSSMFLEYRTGVDAFENVLNTSKMVEDHAPKIGV